MGFSLSDVTSAINPFNTDASLSAVIPGYSQYQGQLAANETNKAIADARNKFEAEEAEKARDFSSAEAIINRQFTSGEAKSLRDWQEKMSSSAVSRRMADMKRAGINPILAGKYDASTPAGAMGTGSQPATAKANAHGAEMKSAFIDLLPLVNSAIDAKAKLANAKLTGAQAENVQVQTKAGEAQLHEKQTSGMTWETIKKDYQRIKSAADKYQSSALEGNGVLDQADRYLDRVIVKPLKEAIMPKGRKLKNPPGKPKKYGDPGNIGYDIPIMRGNF